MRNSIYSTKLYNFLLQIREIGRDKREVKDKIDDVIKRDKRKKKSIG